MAGVWAWAWVGPCALCLLAISNIALAVVLPPQLSASDSRVVVMEGETSLVLQCNLEYGDNPIAYRWLKNQELVTGALGYAYRGLKQVSLALHAIEQQHAGVYTCEASNEAGVHTAFITVVVESTGDQSFSDTEIPHTDETLTAIATSLSDVLAEGDCHCDSLFLLHAAIDVPTETLAAQANLAHTMAENIISSVMRVGVMTYSDYGSLKLSFGRGVDRCSLRDAFKDLSHDLWPTRIGPVFREIFKKFKKSKIPCKVLFLPIFGSLGTEGVDIIGAQHLKKFGVTIFILEVTAAPLPGVSDMASRRGDGQPYHWWVPLDIWPTIVINMKYMSEEIASCPTQEGDMPGKCVGNNEECTSDAECRGIGFGCIEGICQFLECNINPRKPGCCSNTGHYWCGDVTGQCTGPNTICDGRVQCMNGEDEGRCWSQPCPSDKVARCQTSTLCLGLMDLCNGETECPGGEDEDPRFCRSFPCPTNRPFRCRSGKCITKESLCDGSFKDCAEGEDEDLDYCNRVHTCPPTLPFKCDYGICYLDKVVCDGTYNCLDATDELDCKMKNCPGDRPYKCTGSGLCIRMELVCNGVLDGCDDGSDERNCTEITCPVNRSYKCSSGMCINAWLACDGRDDCGDGSDENNCNEASTTTIRPEELSCPVGQFKCLSGACISMERICDGRRNCLNGDDERNCRLRLCPSTRPHRCQDGSCVQASAPCNGFMDCSDGSDEINCTHTNPAYTDAEYEEELEEEYEYEEMEDYEEPPVLSTPSEAPPITPPMKTTIEEEVEEAEPELEPEAEPETRLEEEAEPEDMAAPENDIVLDESPAEVEEKSNMPSNSSENMENNEEEVGDVEDMETILEEPGVQTAASSEKAMEETLGGTCTASLCASLVLAPLLVLSLSNTWMR